MNNLILDIETLSLSAKPVITEIALVGVDLFSASTTDVNNQLIDIMQKTRNNFFHKQVYYTGLPIEEQLRKGHSIDHSTLKFWFENCKKEQYYTGFSDEKSLEDVKIEILNFITRYRTIYNIPQYTINLWSNAPALDIAGLNSLFSKNEYPFNYKNHLCLRTLYKSLGINTKRLYAQFEILCKENDIQLKKHHPVFDCCVSAFILRKCHETGCNVNIFIGENK